MLRLSLERRLVPDERTGAGEGSEVQGAGLVAGRTAASSPGPGAPARAVCPGRRHPRQLRTEGIASRARRNAQIDNAAATAVISMNHGSRASEADSATMRQMCAMASSAKTVPVVSK